MWKEPIQWILQYNWRPSIKNYRENHKDCTKPQILKIKKF